MQNYKGAISMLLTAVFLFLLCRRYFRIQQNLLLQRMQKAEMLSKMQESITDVLFSVNKSWEITHANKASLDFFPASSLKQIVGQNMWHLIPDTPDSTLQKQYNHAFQKQTTIHFEHFFPDLQKWYLVTAIPFEEGLTLHLRDTTQQKQTQKEIVLAKVKLDALINNTSDLIWSIDPTMKLVSSNKAFDNALKAFREAENLKPGDNIIFEEAEHQALSSQWQNYYERALSGERFSCEYQLEYKGVIHQSEINFNPIYDEQQNIIGVGCFARNISERKKMEEERSKLIQRLVKQNKELEEFSFIASHNLRSPVASMLGLIQVFNREDLSDSFNKTVISNLEISVQKLDEIINDLTHILDVRHRIEEAKEVVVMDALMGTIRNMLADAIAQNDAVIQSYFSQPEIVTVKSYLNNILFNLISNAIKYRKKEVPPIIKISFIQHEGFYHFTISDNGLGIDLTKYDSKIFMPYKRFHPHIPGKGIGLYLVKSNVEALGGSIEIESTPGEGTTFHFSIRS
jgi:PAS domain S-box-containing protein